jgi:hypothetical protein
MHPRDGVAIALRVPQPRGSGPMPGNLPQPSLRKPDGVVQPLNNEGASSFACFAKGGMKIFPNPFILGLRGSCLSASVGMDFFRPGETM